MDLTCFQRSLFRLCFSKAAKNESLPVYGEGLIVRDGLYVENHCRGNLACVAKGKVGEVYNLGGHNERNNLYIVKRIFLKWVRTKSKLLMLLTDMIMIRDTQLILLKQMQK